MLKNKLICCVDFEMTDLYEPLELGCVRINTNGEIIDYWETMFCADGKPLIHGQRFKEKGTQTIKQLWGKINGLIKGNYLAAHNIGTDRSLLLKHFPFIKLEGSIDSLNIYKKIYPQQIDNFSLTNLLEIFNLYNNLENLKWNKHFIPHRALFDAAGCALLIMRLLKDDNLKKIFDLPEQKNLL